MDDLRIMFHEFEFHGLKFKLDESSYPWKNDKEASTYFENLIEDGSEISKSKYKNLVKDISVQDLHIAISKSIIFKGLAYVNLFFIAILVFMNLSFYVGLTTVGVTIMLGVGSVMLSNYFNGIANELYAMKDVCTDIVDVAFCKE